MLTATEIIAAITEGLSSNGYRRIEVKGAYWRNPYARMFEDEYGIVASVVFETWEDLSSGWIDAQSALVELISEHITASEAKAWEGYLLLLTSGYAPSEKALSEIRYDMSRVRKIIADARHLGAAPDVLGVILPLLPLGREFDNEQQESLLDLIPGLLVEKEIPKVIGQTIVEAYKNQKPILIELHRVLHS